MSRIIPIRDLKNTTAISQMCHDAKEPIFVTKNGYGDMVVMSMEVFHRAMYLNEVYVGLAAAEAQIAESRTIDAGESMRGIRKRYGV